MELRRRTRGGTVGLTAALLVAMAAAPLVGCGSDSQPTFGGARSKAHHLMRAQFQLAHPSFKAESRGYSPNVVCGLVTAESAHGYIADVEFIANGDTASAVINDQALSFDAKPPVDRDDSKAVEAGVADCIFPQLWKAMCRRPLSDHLLQQQKRCPP